MNVLVTGGAGYIGSHVVKRLAEDDHNVIVYDNLSTGFKENVIYGELIVGDLSDRALLDQVFKEFKFDIVMHLAASIVVPESVADPLNYYCNNVGNTLNLLNCMLNNNVNEIIFSSTAAVYGMPKNPIVDEECPTAPINPYGESKLMIERVLVDLGNARKLNYIALRYFNAIGAAADGTLGERKQDATHLVDNCFRAVLNNQQKLNVFGTDYDTPDGTCIRDYIHVEDIAEAHVLALRYLGNSNDSDVFNCGYGRGYSVLEIVDAAKKVTGKKFSVEYLGRRDGDPPVLIADSKKIKAKLKWKPSYTDMEQMIKTAWEWEEKYKWGKTTSNGY